MTTLREKRHRQCLNTIGRLTEQRELAFRRLAIISDKLKGERLRLNRLQKELGKQPMPKFTPLPTPPAWLEDKVLEHGPPLPTLYPDPIPDFLKRDAKDMAARAEIKAAQDEDRKARSAARAARKQAKERGDLRKMPLTGKAALKAIREG